LEIRKGGQHEAWTENASLGEPVPCATTEFSDWMRNQEKQPPYQTDGNWLLPTRVVRLPSRVRRNLFRHMLVQMPSERINAVLPLTQKNPLVAEPRCELQLEFDHCSSRQRSLPWSLSAPARVVHTDRTTSKRCLPYREHASSHCWFHAASAIPEVGA
jgi:hypothetical protein